MLMEKIRAGINSDSSF